MKIGSCLFNKIRSYGVIFQELRSFLKGVMELEGVKELSHYSVLTFLPRGIIGI